MPNAWKAVFQQCIVAIGFVSLAACGGTEAGGDDGQEKQTTRADPQACYEAAKAEQGEIAALSCLYDAPVDAEGNPAEVMTGGVEAMAVDCENPANYRDYHGPCTSFGGCSTATGGGYSHTQCGSWLYAWLRVCDGRPVGWGYGACAW